MKKFFKVFFIILKIVICLCLAFFAAYAIFTKLIPDILNGQEFFEIIKNIAISIWTQIKNILLI